MKPKGLTGPAWKKQVAPSVSLSQESRGFGLRDNKRCNPDQTTQKATALVELLGAHTTTPTHCWLAIWHGFGQLTGSVQEYTVGGRGLRGLASATPRRTPAAGKGLLRLVAGVNTARREDYRRMLERDFRTDFQGVAMQRPSEH
jgi:hypothetical protein